MENSLSLFAMFIGFGAAFVTLLSARGIPRVFEALVARQVQHQTLDLDFGDEKISIDLRRPEQGEIAKIERAISVIKDRSIHA